MSKELSRKLEQALQQWREDLIDLGLRNPLISFRQRRTSTIDLSSQSIEELLSKIRSKRLSFLVGKVPEPRHNEVDEDDLEEQALIAEDTFDYSNYPDAILVERTQRDVDKIVRNLASRSSKIFLDKGINPLHIAIGGIKWVDDNDEKKIAPLLLLPARFYRPGPRQPFALELNGEDLVVNPAISIKLEQYAVRLPMDKDVTQEYELNGIQGALSLFASVKLPKEWEVIELCSLAFFTFQKESMYRDLLDNQSEILESQIVRALGSGGMEIDERYFFEPVDDSEIDRVAPPETTPVILDADSSQRAAIQAAMEGRSFVLDGPPGTGKSQTISNIIGGLISVGKTVLFVSEKIVALDVVKERLDQRGLGSLVFELHSARTTRKEVAQALGGSLQSKPKVKPSLRDHEIQAARFKREQLSDYASALNEQRIPIGISVFQALGLLEQAGSFSATPEPEIDFSDLSATDLENISESASKLGKHWELYLQGDTAVWFGLENQVQLAYNLEALEVALSEYEQNYGSLYRIATQLRLEGTFEFRNLVDLLEVWAAGRPEFRGREWLTDLDIAGVGSSLTRLSKLGENVAEFRRKFEAIVGASWDSIADETAIGNERELKAISRVLGSISEVPVRDLSRTLDEFAKVVESFGRLIDNVSEFCEGLGIGFPNSFVGLEALRTALQVLEGEAPPPPEWFSSRTRLGTARTAINKLETATIAEGEASVGAKLFTEAVLDLPLNEISIYLEEHGSFFDQFSAVYRQHKRSLKSAGHQRAWKAIVNSLPAAMEWQKARRERETLEGKYAAVLEEHYAGLHTDWDSVRELIGAADLVARGLQIEERDRFGSAWDSPQFVSKLERITRGFSEFELLYKELPGLSDGSFSDEFERKDPNTCVNLFESALAALQKFDISSKEVGLGRISRVPLGQFAEALETLQKFRDREEGFIESVKTISGEIRTQIPQDQFFASPRPFLDELNARFEWTLKLLEMAAQRGASGEVRPLGEKEIDALQAAAIPNALSLSAEKWNKAFDRFAEAFSEARADSLREALHDFKGAAAFIRELKKRLPEIDSWLEFDQHRDLLIEAGLEEVIDAAETLKLRPDQVAGYVRCAVFRGWVDFVIASDSRIADQLLADRDDLVAQFRELDRSLSDHSVSLIVERAEALRPRSLQGQGALIQREAEKKVRHKSVRDQISQSSEVIKALHPCFMMSPLAVSQFLPSDIRFDLVIFDEASQVTPSDAINCIYRGHALITAGDQKQLPPTKFFSTMAIEDDDVEEDVAQDYESILDLMKASGAFNSLTLKWHYRSRHEHLIAFSNRSFYGGKLITFPGAINQSEDLGVKFFRVPDGIYRRSNGQDNPREARAVARRVIHHFKSRPEKSVGVVAFSRAQEDTILAAIALERREHPELDRYFDESQNDRQRGFFVSNLESVQGDERDVIIFSIGYGPDEHGKIYKNFGPISRMGGERRLNVAFTRARELVEVVSSMDASKLGEVTSGPASHLRRYLDFAERGPAALELDLEEVGMAPESPFEESVISEIRSMGFDVVPQVGVAGYRIDIGVVHPKANGTYMLGIECDGAMYHSSRAARDRDRLRHEILEGLGWRLHHIWGTAWYRHRQAEIDKLRLLLQTLGKENPRGRLLSPLAPPSNDVVVEFEEFQASAEFDWISDYQVAVVDDIPKWIDLSETANAGKILPLVAEVVRVEQPVHIEVLMQRLRSAADIGRVGSRIRKTLDRAISRAEVERNGDFLAEDWNLDYPVRRPDPGSPREIDHIHPLELKSALLGATREAIALDEAALVEAVCQIYGWTRKGARIMAVLKSTIQELVAAGELAEGSGGLKIP